MKTTVSKWVGTSLLGIMLGLGAVMSAQAFEISITVAPNVINIQSDAYVVTVHTDINYSDVYAYDVTLNGVAIHTWKADNRGNFVAKFLMADIETLDGLVIGDYNKLVLFGVTTGDIPVAFSGTDRVMVMDVEGRSAR